MSAAPGDREALKEFRPQRTVPAVIVAALLVALGAVVAAEVISGLFGRPLGWLPVRNLLEWGSTTLWQSPAVLIGGIVVTLIGLALLVLAFVPGRPRMVPLHTSDPQLVIGVRPQSFSDTLAHAAGEVPGVRSAVAALRGRTVAVTATTSGWNDAATGEQVREAVLARMAGLAPVQPYKVSVRLKERP
ncbi:DUF6286 domain-containing protein [Nonomuraea endophytica]|uniref:DUF6286 domain-containing protein n=1 Tax=Nonomuraea endophytica TaxID=714136 RepID=A0A7W7ZZT2_9ACTN|nr:DUF6286 domain-containing protein [Nonomuraea endophytica]MBB5076861.1 hypothetical protein [Nonomuraea endophytica]